MSYSDPLTERATLHRINLRVRPLPGHPHYWTCQCGILCVWLFADSPEDAAHRATTIVDALPYERLGTDVAVIKKKPSTLTKPPLSSGPSENTREQCELRRQLAEESGLSMLLIILRVGADDADFESIPLG